MTLTKQQIIRIMAPVDGRVIDLSDVPDPVFSGRMLGDGAAIEPISELIVAPADGILTMIFPTGHAFGMTLANGVEILVHVGINTVELDGRGFQILQIEGENLTCGEPVLKVDTAVISGAGKSMVTIVVVTEPRVITAVAVNLGKNLRAGLEELFSFLPGNT